MSVCSEVDVGLLVDCFDLKPFNGLRRLPDEYVSSDEKEKEREQGLCSRDYYDSLLLENSPLVKFIRNRIRDPRKI